MQSWTAAATKHILQQGGYSWIFEGRHDLIDHIMISHSLLAKFRDVTTGNVQLPTVTEAHPAAETSGLMTTGHI